MTLSLPWDRIIVTKMAKPIEASQAPKVSSISGGRISMWGNAEMVIIDRTMMVKESASRFSRHRRNFVVDVKAQSGAIVMMRRVV